MRIALLTTDSREHFQDYTNPNSYFGTAPEALLQGLASLPEAEVHVISCVQQPVKSPEKIAPNIFYHNLLVPKLGWLRTGYQGCIRAARKKIREIQPDLVHGQGTERDCALNAVFSGFPNVLTIHGNMTAVAAAYRAPIGSFHWLAARLENFVLRRTAGVFCNSAYTEQLVAPRTARTWRVPNAVRLDFYSPMPERRPVPKPVLLNVGVVTPYKRQLELLAVARKLHQRGLQFEWQFAGGLSSHTECGAAFGRELALAEKAGYARHLGVLTVDKLVQALDSASAMVHFPTEESFGLVVAEALARNLKLFGSAVGGLIDIAEGISGAELIPVGDFSALENAIAAWLNAGCPNLQGSASVMRQRYHPELIAKRHLEIYCEVLRPRRQNPDLKTEGL